MKSMKLPLCLAGFFVFISTSVIAQTATTQSQLMTSSSPCSATISPTYGPRNGSTTITITVITGSTKVTGVINVTVCPLPHTNGMVDCSSISITGYTFNATIGTSGSAGMSVYVNTGTCVNVSAGNFNYTDNPTNLALFKGNDAQTIIVGGIQLLFQGNGLNSTSSPPQLVFSVSPGVKSKGSPCTMVNSTVMSCPTPDLSSLLTITSSSGSPVTPIIRFDNDDVGMSTTTSIQVYASPNLTQLTPLQPFINNQNQAITIKGTNLIGHGFTVDDVTVTVGQAKWMTTGSNLCTNVSLTNTSITCQPPPMNTDLIRYSSTTDIDPSKPNVTVLIGAYSFSANQLQYTIDESFNIIMSVMIGILGFVIVMSVICILLTCCGCGRRPSSSLPTVSAAPYESLTADETKSTTSSNEDLSRMSKTSKKSRSSVLGTPPVESGIQVKAVRKSSEFDNEGYVNVGDVKL